MRAWCCVVGQGSVRFRVPWVDGLLCGVDGAPVCSLVGRQLALKLRIWLGFGAVVGGTPGSAHAASDCKEHSGKLRVAHQLGNSLIVGCVPTQPPVQLAPFVKIAAAGYVEGRLCFLDPVADGGSCGMVCSCCHIGLSWPQHRVFVV